MISRAITSLILVGILSTMNLTAYYYNDSPNRPMDARDRDILRRADRKGNWAYKQNWRYDREAFYNGYTQAEAYDKENPDGIGGIGFEPDTEYLQMRNYYLQQSRNNGKRNYPRQIQSNTINQYQYQNDGWYRQ